MDVVEVEIWDKSVAFDFVSNCTVISFLGFCFVDKLVLFA